MSNREKSFTEAIRSKFITLPGEELIFIQRKHWLAFTTPIVILIATTIVAIATFMTTFRFYEDYLIQALSWASLFFVFMASLCLRSIVDWYFNVYVVTNRKIIEVSYSPLSSHKINQVLLDQVRCTEIDTKIEGIVNDFLDIGDVIVTFDRPTHEEEFVFQYIKDPRDVEQFLQNAVSHPRAERDYPYPTVKSGQDLGFYRKSVKLPNKSNKWMYTEELHNYLENGVVWNI